MPSAAASLVSALVLFGPCAAPAQTGAPPEARSTGLPTGLDWTFNFDASWGTFGFANSLFQNPKEGVEENLSDQWFEGAVKPKLSGTFRLASSSEFHGTLSGVGERSYGSAPELVGADFSSFQVEDLAIGWRSGKALGAGENAIDLTVGRTQYRLGHGFLLYDGAAEGGSRGGYWTNARRAFQFAAIARLSPGPHRIEAFYLDKDDLPENETGTRLWGTNYEFAVADHSTFGATYMKFTADPESRPGRDGLDVFNLRAYTAPLRAVPDLSFEAEYAAERNGDLLDSNAWTLQATYAFSGARWTPALTYRYALFEGDDPATDRNEAFDSLLTGFHDWGTWWQGEIAGEYFLANSNLISHQVRLHMAPSASVEGGVMLYKFTLDHPATFAPGVTDPDVAFELDAYVDWSLNDNITASFVGAFANPQRAVEQATGRTKNFAYGMAFIAYSY